MQVTIIKKPPAWSERVPRSLPVGACALFLFLLNAGLCPELFTAEFTVRMESIEGSYMAFSHWIGSHWSNLGWFPLGYGGMPWVQVYQPGFHVVVAFISTMLAWTTQHAYHFLAACEYCLGPVTLFLLCFEAARRIGYAFTAGVVYSLISPASLFIHAIRADTEHLTTGRRFVVLTRYGEGPHTTALMMIPLVLLCLHYAVTDRRRWAVGLAPPALAAVALTNWPARSAWRWRSQLIFSRGLAPRGQCGGSLCLQSPPSHTCSQAPGFPRPLSGLCHATLGSPTERSWDTGNSAA